MNASSPASAAALAGLTADAIGYGVRFLRKHGWRMILWFFCLLLPLWGFASLVGEYHEKAAFPFDAPVLNALHDWATPALSRFFILMTRLGYFWGVVPLDVLLLMILLFRRRFRDGLFFGIAVIGSAILNIAAKNHFARARPDLWISVMPETTYSFPSGHAMGSITLAIAIILLCWPTRWRWLIAFTAAAFVLLVGISRVYLGVHYPSDILAGWTAAMAWTMGMYFLVDQEAAPPPPVQPPAGIRLVRRRKANTWRKTATLAYHAGIDETAPLREVTNNGGGRSGKVLGGGTQPRDASAPVFISYASLDVAVANSIVENLERHRINCWIAPRDVTPGLQHTDEIVAAINNAKVLVLVLSEHAVASPHVGREVERAASKRRGIIGLRTEAVPLTRSFEYFLSESQWIDVAALGMPAALTKLTQAVGQRLAPSSWVSPGLGTDVKNPADRNRKPSYLTIKRVIAAAVFLVAAALVVGVLVRYWPSKQGGSPAPVALHG